VRNLVLSSSLDVLVSFKAFIGTETSHKRDARSSIVPEEEMALLI
jgi:hypothetical protein